MCCTKGILIGRSIINKKNVDVAITPNGYADGLAKDIDGIEYFVMPEEKQMTMEAFLNELDGTEKFVHSS